MKRPSRIQTHQLVNAVNGPVVLVTQPLHTLEALRTRGEKSIQTLCERQYQLPKNSLLHNVALKMLHFQICVSCDMDKAQGTDYLQHFRF